MARLTTPSDNGVLRFELIAGTETTIGRHPNCTIVVDSGAVSRLHVRVRDASAGGFEVEDAGSRNGTFVNGQLISGPHPLKPGDQIRVSEVEFQFEDDSRSASTGAAPAFMGTEGSSSGGNFSSGNRSAPDPMAVPGAGINEMTFDGNAFDVMMVDEEVASKVDFRSDDAGVKMVATPEAKLQALMKINRVMSGSMSLDEALPNLLSGLFEIFPAADRGFVVLRGTDGALIPRWVKHRRTGDDDTVRISRTIIQTTIDSGEPILSFDASDDSRFDSSESIADFSIRSFVCAPLTNADGDAFGALQIDSTSGAGQFREDDVDLLAGVAAQAGILINNASMYEQTLAQREVEQDLKLATEVQQAFLPLAPPATSAFTTSSYYKAAHHIGGDYFDYIPLDNDRFAVVVADVVGHGVAAAMFMAKLAAETRFSLASESDPAKAIERLNDKMSALLVERFITFIVVILDPNDDHMTIVNAGHMPPVFRPHDAGDGPPIIEPGEEESGLPIAISEGIEYEICRQPFRTGDLFVLYTDGVNEAMNSSDEEFGIDAVKSIVAEGGDAEAVTKRLVDAVAKHIGDAPPFDDMAMVVVERK